MRPVVRPLAALGLALLALLAAPPARAGGDKEKEARFLKNIRQVTTGKEGERAGEPYFSPDGKSLIYQAVRDGHPYYQIYTVSVEGGEPRMLSTGKGKTTCSYFHPTDSDKFLYASSHLDERTHAAPPPEDPNKPKSYKWDYDGSFDIFEGSLKTAQVTRRLTDAPGYDAEGSYSHDGTKVCFTSGREGPNAIWVMDADGKNPARIGPEKATGLAGGGPFFMPGDKEVLYRGQKDGDPRAPMHVFVTSLDGKTTKQLSRAPRMNWCPFPHPDGKKVVYAAALEGHRNFELFLLKTDGSFKEVRLTWDDGFDALPSFSPDGKKLAWTSSRHGGSPQVYVADFVDPPEDAYEVQTDQPEAPPAANPHGDKPADPHANPHGDKPADPHANPHEGQKDPHESANPHGDKPADPHANPHGDKPADPHGDKPADSHGDKPADPHAKADPKADPKAKNPHESSAFDPKTSGVIKGSEGFAGDAAKNVPGADHVEELGLMTDDRWLADPEREGRRAGSFGEKEAARYVIQRFQELGIAPGGADGSYEDPFTVLAGAKVIREKCHFAFENSARGFSKDAWQPLLYSSNGEVTGDLVFCGYGVEDKDRNYDDYGLVDVKGKVALVFTRAPRCEKGGAFGSDHPTMVEDLRFKVSLAKNHGAIAVMIVRSEGEGWLELGYGDPGIPVIQFDRKTLLDLMNEGSHVDLEAERKKIDETLTPNSHPIPYPGAANSKDAKGAAWRPMIGVAIQKETALSRNVIGRVEGTSGSRDVIVVGAHMDHLGLGGDGSLAPGVKAIHPGADDNASGVAGMLALARAIKSFPLKHTVVFMAFGGEEMGLLGSAHWVKQPTLSLGRIEAMLNMDMIGRLGQKPLVCGGYGTAKEWPDVVTKAAKAVGLDVATSRDGFGPSDHASFYGKDIPVLFLFTGSHADYHKPSDTADKIDGPGLEKCARFALAAVREIDALPARPSFEKVGSNPHGGDTVVTGEKGPYFGSVPDYSEGDAETTDGVKITGARPGSPAEKAGIKAGDRIVEFDGKPIKNLYDYTYAIRGAKTGVPLKVVVVRDGKNVTLEATLVTR